MLVTGVCNTIAVWVIHFKMTRPILYSPEISRSEACLEHCQYVGSSGDLEHCQCVGRIVSRFALGSFQVKINVENKNEERRFDLESREISMKS